MNSQSLKGKAAVVTGGTRGIGLAIAKALAEEGVGVLISGTKQETVDKALEKLAPAGRVAGVAADVTKLAEVQKMLAAAQQQFGGIDILINNAGIGIFTPWRT